MINILLSGYNGRMGQEVVRIAGQYRDMNIVAGYDIKTNGQPNVYTDLKNCEQKVDVIIDFSNPQALPSIIAFATSKKLPVVVATTGLTKLLGEELTKLSHVVPVFVSSNMSLGVNLMVNLAQKAASVLANGFDIEIVEKHHNKKLDAPSGTALSIADAINTVKHEKYKYVYDRHILREERSKNEIGIHSVRGGTIVGVHEVIFAGTDEIIEIKHTAMSRDIFAEGALKAAKFICNKPAGMYSMQHLIADSSV